MIRSLHLENFRGFPHYEVGKLGRINLFVGTNNSGKTSLLEAIELLVAEGDALTLWNSLSRRGESLLVDDQREDQRKLDVSHLFWGHSPEIGSKLTIQAHTDSGSQALSAILRDTTATDMFSSSELTAILMLEWESNKRHETNEIHLNDGFAMSGGPMRWRARRMKPSAPPIVFITTDSLSQYDVTEALSAVVLDPEEGLVIQALQLIDPSIERIAPVFSRSPSATSKGGVVIKSSKYPTRLPIGTMGDGIWHLMSLALAMVRARGGVLLVDEIDTGLHYSVMENMWHLVQQTARRLDVQVFATTHSSDCWKALASICSREKLDGSEVSMQRIEPDKPQAIVFQEQEIVVAAEQDIEVR